MTINIKLHHNFFYLQEAIKNKETKHTKRYYNLKSMQCTCSLKYIKVIN